MKTTLHVHYCLDKFIEGFRYLDYKTDNNSYVYLGEIEIDNPFNVPDSSILTNAKIEHINAEIKEHKAKINLLENQVKDLLCIENKQVDDEHEEEQEDHYCQSCSGTGEGQYDGAKCIYCKGMGVLR